MISSSHLNKLIKFIFFFIIVFFDSALATDPVDIWKKKEEQKKEENKIEEEKEKIIKSPIISEDINKITIKINQQELSKSEQKIIGLFDPQKNNFNINMWSSSDGKDIKNIFNRINKLKLSKFSENLLFEVLFTNAYPPRINLTSNEFLKIKIDWLIKNEKIEDLINLLKSNQDVGHQPKAVKFLINEYLSSTDIKSACEDINLISKNIQNDDLDKFLIYCLIYNDQKEKAQLVFDILKETGFKDKFYENKINFLLGITETASQKILDDNLFNFYLSHITSNKFEYMPDEKTDKYIWRYLSLANLIQISENENEETILTYEKAAMNDSFEKDEIFKIYLKVFFNFNELKNASEIYKNLPGYKARALLYQGVMLSENPKKKIELSFLLRDLFAKDKMSNVYADEFSSILKNIDQDDIPEDYRDLVQQNIQQDSASASEIKFDNDILHRSKVLKHFLDNKFAKERRTQKDFNAVYKKIKRNKKYFISINDIVVLESLKADGINLPNDLEYEELSSQLSIPENLYELAQNNQIGLVMLKIIEIIGEDKVKDLDPETIYFLSKILNELNLKKIRNNILSEALPVRV